MLGYYQLVLDGSMYPKFPFLTGAAVFCKIGLPEALRCGYVGIMERYLADRHIKDKSLPDMLTYLAERLETFRDATTTYLVMDTNDTPDEVLKEMDDRLLRDYRFFAVPFAIVEHSEGTSLIYPEASLHGSVGTRGYHLLTCESLRLISMEIDELRSRIDELTKATHHHESLIALGTRDRYGGKK